MIERSRAPVHRRTPCFPGGRLSRRAQIQEATWRSGDAADCKSAYPGSIPGVASNFPSMMKATCSGCKAPGGEACDGPARGNRIRRSAQTTIRHELPLSLEVAQPLRDDEGDSLSGLVHNLHQIRMDPDEVLQRSIVQGHLAFRSPKRTGTDSGYGCRNTFHGFGNQRTRAEGTAASVPERCRLRGACISDTGTAVANAGSELDQEIRMPALVRDQQIVSNRRETG